MKYISLILVLVLFAACGTDHPFDRGDDLPPGNEFIIPSAPPSFASDVMPALQACASCHSGGAGGWVYAGGVESYDAVFDKVDLITPEDSELLIKATGGDGHGGGALFAANSSSHEAIVIWIGQGAKYN